MLLAIIGAAACLTVATMMYTSKMRAYGFYRPVAVFFLFEGIWVMLDYIVRQISPDSMVMMVIHYIGLIVLAGYFVLKILFDSNDKIKDKIKKKKDTD